VGLKQLWSAPWIGNTARQHGVSVGSVKNYKDFIAAVLDMFNSAVEWPEAMPIRGTIPRRKGQSALLMVRSFIFESGFAFPTDKSMRTTAIINQRHTA